MREPFAPKRLTGPAPIETPQRPALGRLTDLLLGPSAGGSDLPTATDVITAVLTLAEGKRRKVLLPLTDSTGEIALVRRGPCVLVTYYDAGTVPQVFVRDRAVPLASLLPACARAAHEAATVCSPGIARRAAQRLHERARGVQVVRDEALPPAVQEKLGGAQGAPRDDAPLAFGFALQIPAPEEAPADPGSRADLHALLFDGTLWAYVGGRKLVLSEGATLPVVERLLSAARAVVDGWERNQPVHVRLRAGDCAVAVRLETDGNLSLTLGGPARQSLGLPPTDVPSTVLPILRLLSDFVRTVVSVDRSQSRNLRLCSLRDEVRALRRLVRARSERRSFTNGDAELLRARVQAESERSGGSEAGNAQEPFGKLRFSLRWHVEIDGLDAAATYLCGDRLVIATTRNVFALDREDGGVLWIRETGGAASMMAGQRLLGVHPDGEITISDVMDGEPYARARIAPRVAAPPAGTFVGGRHTPPLAVLAEGRDRLVAIDLRSGEPRWRFRSRGRGDFRLTRAGRVLLIVTGDGTLDALDVASGEVLWRWSDRGRIVLPPTLMRDTVVAVSGTPAARQSTWMGFDLYSGKQVWQTTLEGGPVSPGVPAGPVIVAAQRSGARAELHGLDPSSGAVVWRTTDPGLSAGGAALDVDRRLVINAPTGSCYGLDTETGELAWQARLADPLRDDVPRRLEPVLRGGALFVPSASVHALRPLDGSALGTAVADELVPDFLRVDERGWLYVAEESGHVEAYAPIPNLRLVKG